MDVSANESTWPPPWRTMCVNKPRVIQASQQARWRYHTMKEKDVDTLNPLFSDIKHDPRCAHRIEQVVD